MERIEFEKTVKQLSHFGCTSREATIYVNLLHTGPTTVQQIAKRLEFNRVTVHSAIEQLLKKGLVAETRVDRRRLLVAEHPEILFRMLQKKENDLMLAKMNLSPVVSFLSSLQAPTHKDLNLRFYRGLDGLKHMLEESLCSRNEALVFCDINQFVKLLSADYLMQFYARRSKLGISSRLIWPKSNVFKKVWPKLEAYKMTIRIFTRQYSWNVGIFSWNECVAIMSLADNEITCTVIESAEISRFYRETIFDSLWDIAS